MAFLEEQIEEYDRVIQTVWETKPGGKREIVGILGVVVLLGNDESPPVMVSIQKLEDGSFGWSTGNKSGMSETFWRAWESIQNALVAEHGKKAEPLELKL